MIIIQKITVPTFVLTASIMAACGEESVGSQSVATKDFSAEIHVTNNQNQIIDVEVMLRSGTINTGTDVYLDEGDELFATTAVAPSQIVVGDNQFQDINSNTGTTKKLKQASGKSSAFFRSHQIWYFNQFPANQLDQEFTVILERRDNLDARNSKVHFPAAFSIISPVTGEYLSRGVDINVSWDSFNNEDTVQVTANLTCSTGATQEWRSAEMMNSSGVFTLPANTFAFYPGNCSLSIRVDRRNIGQIDPLFTRGGIIIGHQLQTVVINTSP